MSSQVSDPTAGRALRVAWDMTHAGRIQAGTGVYGRCLTEALEKEPSVRVIRIAQPCAASWGEGGAGKLARGLGQALWTQVGLAREARRCGADLLHAPAFVSSLFLPCPLVVTVHDVVYRRYPQHYSRAWLLYLLLLVPAVVRRAKAVVAVSHHAKREIGRYLGTRAQKVHVIYPGVNRRRFKPIRDRRRLAAAAARQGLDGPFILHVGTLAARKNVPTLLRAIHSLKKAGSWGERRVVLAGGTQPDLPGRTEVEATIEELGLRRDVVLLGHVPDHDLPALYNLADLVAMPTLHEGFGSPVLEAMACGRPVVASNTSSIPEVAGGAAQLVEPTNVEAWASTLERVLSDRELRESMGERGLERAKAFSWENAARQTIEVYRGVLTAAGGRDGAAPIPDTMGDSTQ